ncbi:MAG: LysR family transcriptional regulator [Pseudomonas sp.]|nr:LysR family transcriptional regulator [Pseudomonas sp.]
MTQKLPKQPFTSPPIELNSHDLAHNLVDLYWFLQVVDAGSFSIAATNHSVSKSSLSRRISQLETRLGVQLLHRNPRFLTLTSIGAQVYRHTLEMLNAAQQATDSVQHALATPSGHLNIVLPAIFNHWLLPVLLNFKKIYPQIQITLSTADRTQEMISQSVDLALSLFAAPSDSTQIVSRSLAELSFVNVLSSSLNHTDQHTHIQLAELSNENNSNTLQVNNFLSAYEAVLAGFGYASLPLCVCNTALRTGDLKFLNDKETMHTLYAFTQPHRGITLATRVLLDYLTLHMAQSRMTGIYPLQPTQDSQ